MTNFSPVLDRIIVQRDAAPTQTESGILFLANTALEKSNQGTVVAVGPGRHKPDGTLIPVDVKAGDRVLFTRFNGQTIEVGGEEYLILAPHDIMAVVE
jgi:chaperonin GroES